MRGLSRSDILVYILADRGKVFGSRHHIDIEDPPELGLMEFILSDDRPDRRDCFQRSRGFAVRRSQRDLFEVIQRLYLCLRILTCEHIVVAGLRIDPVAGGDHSVRSHRRDDTIDDGLRGQAFEACLLAIDVEGETWVVDVLRDQNITYTTESSHLLRKLLH